MINLLDLNYEEVEKLVTEELKLPKFRAKQLFGWLVSGTEADEMTNLPKEMKEKIKAISYPVLPKIHDVFSSKLDETKKFLFVMHDGVLVESVLMKYKYGWSVCISSQAGCRMGCKFCASSGIAFSRSLTPGEILGQIVAINKHENIKISHIVIMGIGEPLDNYDNIIKFLNNVTAEEGLNISARKISLSTCGVVPGIYKLADEKIPVTLSISLHNAIDEERSKIMPINRKYNLDELFLACKNYLEKTNRRITFEYALINGVTDTRHHANELIKRLKDIPLSHVNLIPVNAVEGNGFTRPTRENIDRFQKWLEDAGVSATVRRELGRDISAACGQLRKSNMPEVKNSMIDFSVNRTGIRRDHCEDDLASADSKDGKVKFYVVSDGMGGENAGEVASKITVETFAEACREYEFDSVSGLKTFMKDAIKKADKEIAARRREDPALSGMGSTFVGVAVVPENDRLIFANVGDSRGYLIKDGKLVKVTKDDSRNEEYRDMGLSEEEIENCNEGNVITKAMGYLEPLDEPSIYERRIQEADALLLCSDGLCGYMRDAEIEAEISGKEINEGLCESLADAAVKSNSRDDITITIVKF